MIQTLGLAQIEIEPLPRTIEEVAQDDENESRFERVISLRKTLSTQTGPSSQNQQGAGIVPPSQTIGKFEENSEDTAELGRVASNGNSPSGALGFAERLQGTGAGSGSEVAEGIGNFNPLGQIPVDEINVEPLSKIVFYTDPRGVAADRFRFLRMRIRELSDARNLKSLLITSALSLDGKSTVSLNLATALAERGQSPVLLLEADLYHPTLAERLGLKTGPGLAECLSSGMTPLSVVRRIEPLGWYFLPAGRQLADPSDLLHGDGFAAIMGALSPHFKWIVIDSPPIVPVADALALAHQADASLLVVRAGQTPSDAVESALESLGAKHVMGVILNGVEDLQRLYSKYNKYYGPPAPSK
jgi:capsular exopolysaccharide synthesis family protein